MPRDRRQRRADDLRAVGVLVANLIPVQQTVAAALADVDPGQTELPDCIRDARLVADIAQRLDALIPAPDPVETWDGLLWFLVASIGLAIYRRTHRSSVATEKAEKLAQRMLANATQRYQAVAG